jgi:Do/DeqQ family serine protease
MGLDEERRHAPCMAPFLSPMGGLARLRAVGMDEPPGILAAGGARGKGSASGGLMSSKVIIGSGAWKALIGTVLLVVSHVVAEAQRSVPQTRAELGYSFAPVVKKAAPAVVNVYVQSTRRVASSPFMNDPFFRDFFGRGFGLPRNRTQNSLGSGVIVTAAGLVVTNAHVIKSHGQATIRVVLSDKREFNARVVLSDEKTDIAILQIADERERFPHLQFADSDALEVGDIVLAIGNPFGVGQTVTSGIISALARTGVGKSDAQVFIQTDAAINPGNSGGALVDVDGRLVGINTAIYSRTGGSHGIGFAIPANLVRLYVSSAVTGRKIERPWLGGRLTTVTRTIAEGLGLKRVAGAVVSQLYADGPATRAGLRVGDVIVSVDGREVADARAALYRLTTRGIGNTSELMVMRQGRRVDLRLTLEAAPEPGPGDVRVLAGEHPFAGAQVANLLPVITERLKIEVEPEDGVVILEVAPGSIAESIGFRPGDVLLRLGRERVASVEDLERKLRVRARIWSIAIRRGRRILRVEVPG